MPGLRQTPDMNPQESNETFTAPPLDGSCSPSDVLDFHIAHSPNWVWSKWIDQASGLVKELKFKEFGRMVQQQAIDISENLGVDLRGGDLSPSKGTGGALSRPVIALLGEGESTLLYFVLILGCLRAGAVPFPISSNNSKEAVEHLLRATSASFVVDCWPKSASMIELNLPQIQYPSLTRLLQLDSSFQFLQTSPKREWDEPAMILHSSGSTDFPKPITYPLFSMMWCFRLLNFGEEPILGKTLFCGQLPSSHAMCIQWGLLSSLGGGSTLGLRDPRTPKPPTPESTLSEAIQLESTFLLAVPAFYQAWSETGGAEKQLKKMRCISSGGPLCPQIASNLRDEQGIQLISALGSTECGIMSKYPVTSSASSDPLKFHFQPNPQIRMLFRSQSDSDQYEMLIASTSHYSPNVFNDVHEGEKVYATSDLVEKVERGGNIYVKVVGRLDDQIIHSTGEKTNPGPLQGILATDPMISAALYFGRQKHQAGVLIEPSKGTKIECVSEFREAIWATVEKANQLAPVHSALSKNMIIVASPSKPFTYTAKGSIRGGAILKSYSEEIEEIYRSADEIMECQVVIPSVWDEENAFSFVANTVEVALESSINQHQDFFATGCNSLRANRIRTILSRSIPGKCLEPEIVFNFPTIASLSSAFFKVIEGTDASSVSDTTQHIKAMEAMVQKYSYTFPSRIIAVTQKPKGEVVLLTGSTGSLGTILLSHLLRNPSVSQVFALNRPSSSKSLEIRQREAFEDKGLKATLLASRKLQLVETNLDQDQLGLNETLYSELRDSTTLIIHSAWRLDFNLSLGSFEEHIRGSRNLVDLALNSPKINPPKFIFTSSIAAVGGFNEEGKPVPEEDFLDRLEVSVGGGYGESKAVTERILVNASQAGLESCAVRIDQISGSSNGSWSTSDWFPAMVNSAQHLGCLPNFPNEEVIVTWISSEDVASAILDFGFSKLDGEVTPPTSLSPHQTFHIAHPNPTTWKFISSTLSDELKVPLVPYSTWLEKLEASSVPLEIMPARKLLSFFQNVSESDTGYSNGSKEAMSVRRLNTTFSEKASKSLREARKLDVKMWISYWRSKGFICRR